MAASCDSEASSLEESNRSSDAPPNKTEQNPTDDFSSNVKVVFDETGNTLHLTVSLPNTSALKIVRNWTDFPPSNMSEQGITTWDVSRGALILIARAAFAVSHSRASSLLQECGCWKGV